MQESKTTKRTTKFPLDWHIQGHKNHKRHLVDLIERRNKLNEDIKRSEKDLEFKTAQINEAVARGMKEFDPDKLLKKRKAS